MRRSLVAALVVASLAAAAGCANPQNIAPRPGESTTTTRDEPAPETTNGGGGEDETEQVCEQALSVSGEAETELTEKLEEAQTAANSGNTAAALAAATEAREIAEGWKSELEGLAARPIDDDVRDTLEDGIATIDEILTANPQNLDAAQARQDVEGFLDDLEQVCG